MFELFSKDAWISNNLDSEINSWGTLYLLLLKLVTKLIPSNNLTGLFKSTASPVAYNNQGKDSIILVKFKSEAGSDSSGTWILRLRR